MIIANNCSTRVTRLLGTKAVSVLATLVLLSYTKSLRILITAFSFTTLTGSQDYHSVVWLADGNIKYFQPKHLLFSSYIVALLYSAPASGSSLYSHSDCCSGICFLVFLGTCVGHVWNRVCNAGTGRRSEPTERKEDQH